jgi:signal transduction histidine kinase
MNALLELARQTTGLFRVRCRFHCRKPVQVEDSALAGHLFRIAQEAVNNALKHGKPHMIGIHLRSTRGDLALRITDDGKGIRPVSPRRQGLGLRIMQYRASLLRGTVTVQPRRGGGTEVVCTTRCARPAVKQPRK